MTFDNLVLKVKRKVKRTGTTVKVDRWGRITFYRPGFAPATNLLAFVCDLHRPGGDRKYCTIVNRPQRDMVLWATCYPEAGMGFLVPSTKRAAVAKRRKLFKALNLNPKRL